MRLVTLAFATPQEFLDAYHPADGGSLSTRTRTDATIGEDILLEISVPGLPNRALVRAQVMGIAFEHGLRFAFAPEDATTRDFLLQVARGDIAIQVTHRGHARFPATLHGSWAARGGAPTTAVFEDLSAGGAFVRAAEPPAVATEVELTITAPSGEALVATGTVAWLRQGKDPGFGVEFHDLPGENGRKLRAMLRHASESANVVLES
ncbi:MAG: PilZ domain-containing protein [Kofleriaceae bacterium]|nr:PilZ domain-containing protein [Kofleriaceae bacterium]MCL4225271.1 PilZ domain-containing protein [Myxococcales bacterium]